MKVTNSEASSLEDSEGWGEKERKGSVEVLTAFRDVGGVSKTVLRRTELALRACCEPSRALGTLHVPRTHSPGWDCHLRTRKCSKTSPYPRSHSWVHTPVYWRPLLFGRSEVLAEAKCLGGFFALKSNF